MDWSKLDAGLAAALAESDGSDLFVVFVHVTGEAAPDDLAAAGLDPAERSEVRTARASDADIRRLSDRPWVRRLVLSRRLTLSGEA